MVQVNPASSSSAYSSPTPPLACFGDSPNEYSGEGFETEQVVQMRDPGTQLQAIPLVLSFSNLTYSVKISQELNWSSIFPCSNKSNINSVREPETKVLLNDICGEAREGEILAVLGPSGSGKSTLLDALANRISQGSLKGTITMNGTQLDANLHKVISAYVMQDDLLFPMLTVEETLMFAAELTLPRTLSKFKKTSRVEELINQLDLQEAAKTRIGEEGHRGVSGGERRRASIGVGIMKDPILLFLDEPTSGLDSTSAFMVAKVLQRIARTGSIVVMSVHQPSSRILAILDRLLFLTHGQIVYSGSPSNLQLYMEDLQYLIPSDENPSEAALDLICDLQNSSDGINSLVEFHLAWENEKTGAVAGVDQSPEHGFTLMELIQCSISRGKLVSGSIANISSDANPTSEIRKFANPFWTEISVLSRRSFLNFCRMPEIFATRFGATLATGLILASLFWQHDHSKRASEERVKYLGFIAGSIFFICGDGMVNIINERHIMLRETSYNAYRRFSYCLSDALTWMPSIFLLAIVYSSCTFRGSGLSGGLIGFLIYSAIIAASFWAGISFIIFLSGAIADVITGFAVVITSVSSFALFCGVLLSQNEIPPYWIWFHYLSPTKYLYAAIMQNEYRDPTRCVVKANEAFDITPTVAIPIGLKEELLRGMSDVLGVNITGSTCMTIGPDVLKDKGITDLSMWECFWITIAWGFLFRILHYFTLLLGNKNKRK